MGSVLYIKSLRGQWKTQENVSNWQMNREASKSKKVPRPEENDGIISFRCYVRTQNLLKAYIMRLEETGCPMRREVDES